MYKKLKENMWTNEWANNIQSTKCDNISMSMIINSRRCRYSKTAVRISLNDKINSCKLEKPLKKPDWLCLNYILFLK